MSFEDSNLSIDDYFGGKDIYANKPAHVPKPQLVGSFPTYEQVDAYTKKLQKYESTQREISEWQKENSETLKKRQTEFFDYFCDWVGIEKTHPKASLLYSKAWEREHSYSYNSVLQEGEYLVDLVV
jgi:hypothetical protein